MNVKLLIPKDKHDNANLKIIDNLSDEEIQPIIYDLLTWIQDYNWPIADEVLKILIKREKLVFPYIKDILNGNDIMWKYWILNLLMPAYSDIHKKELKEILINMIKNPKTDEDTEVIRETAIDCYKKWFEGGE